MYGNPLYNSLHEGRPGRRSSSGEYGTRGVTPHAAAVNGRAEGGQPPSPQQPSHTAADGVPPTAYRQPPTANRLQPAANRLPPTHFNPGQVPRQSAREAHLLRRPSQGICWALSLLPVSDTIERPADRSELNKTRAGKAHTRAGERTTRHARRAPERPKPNPAKRRTPPHSTAQSQKSRQSLSHKQACS